MAVKVMFARPIAQDVANDELKAAGPAQEKKPRRRRSSVYDADGNEVFITLMCLKCRKMRPLSQFGLRKMADGAIRNQPWCRTCRSGATEKPSRRKGAALDAGAPETAAPSGGAASQAQPAPPEQGPDEKPRSASALAAEVAAALAAGSGR